MSSAKSDQLLEILRDGGLTTLPAPVQLASGQWSRYFIDGKEALAAGADLRLAAEAIWERVAEAGVRFDAVGGLTLGADALAAAIALVSETNWFIVRKAPKGRGTDRRIEGARIGDGDHVLLVDDVVTTGGSILQAFDVVQATGAEVVAAVTLADRGDDAAREFAQRSVPYFPMATYHDLGIPRVGEEQAAATAG
ncbi:orotate phosphoribosyltransferase [Candidatus Poriferisodalis sp.]|uniref:orotate phosphoribosyltransferase n=1 Tax=Candidatus Poriferisodalis sp. TaxID=3101277 RepID=UPI003AF7BAEC